MNFEYSESYYKNYIFTGFFILGLGLFLFILFISQIFKNIPIFHYVLFLSCLVVFITGIPRIIKGCKYQSIKYELDYSGFKIVHPQGFKTVIRWEDINGVSETRNSILIMTPRGLEEISKHLNNFDEFYELFQKFTKTKGQSLSQKKMVEVVRPSPLSAKPGEKSERSTYEKKTSSNAKTFIEIHSWSINKKDISKDTLSTEEIIKEIFSTKIEKSDMGEKKEENLKIDFAPAEPVAITEREDLNRSPDFPVPVQRPNKSEKGESLLLSLDREEKEDFILASESLLPSICEEDFESPVAMAVEPVILSSQAEEADVKTNPSEETGIAEEKESLLKRLQLPRRESKSHESSIEPSGKRSRLFERILKFPGPEAREELEDKYETEELPLWIPEKTRDILPGGSSEIVSDDICKHIQAEVCELVPEAKGKFLAEQINKPVQDDTGGLISEKPQELAPEDPCEFEIPDFTPSFSSPRVIYGYGYEKLNVDDPLSRDTKKLEVENFLKRYTQIIESSIKSEKSSKSIVKDSRKNPVFPSIGSISSIRDFGTSEIETEETSVDIPGLKIESETQPIKLSGADSGDPIKESESLEMYETELKSRNSTGKQAIEKVELEKSVDLIRNLNISKSGDSKIELLRSERGMLGYKRRTKRDAKNINQEKVADAGKAAETEKEVSSSTSVNLFSPKVPKDPALFKGENGAKCEEDITVESILRALARKLQKIIYGK